ncbi:MAG: hypothetical protein RL562_201, partial [Planctomycetota bacterium]
LGKTALRIPVVGGRAAFEAAIGG